MKQLHYILLLFSISICSQTPIETELIKHIPLNADKLVLVDNFETIYFIKDDVFQKKSNKDTITYNNLQLGTLHDANAFNSLKINLFYKYFNTVIILDNRLAEIFKIDFNALPDYKNVTHISTGHDNTIWIFNQDLQQLELFDYKHTKTRAQTVPVQSKVLDLTSNYNFCWLLTEKYLYVYNYFGSLLKKVKNNGFTALVESQSNLFLKKDNALFFLKNNQDQAQPIPTPNLLINQFFVTHETMYIYNSETLQEYQLKIK